MKNEAGKEEWGHIVYRRILVPIMTAIDIF